MTRMFRCCMALPVLLCGVMRGTGAPAKSPGKAPASNLLTIHLERKRGDHAESMRPDHVFETGDIVRFRVTGGQNGFLYVLDHGSSGSYATLFPAAGSSAQNRIQKGAEYLVPATEDGWFQVEAPAGFEVIYFLLSPTPLHVSAEDATPSPPPAPSPADSLLPRCNDSIFQARGECVDSSAGPAPLARDAPLPPQISVAAPGVSRDIIFSAGDEENSVQASAPAAEPVVYTFRLAHR